MADPVTRSSGSQRETAWRPSSSAAHELRGDRGGGTRTGAWDSSPLEVHRYAHKPTLRVLHANGKPIATLKKDVNLLPPVTNPQSFRDFYAFEQHVRAARKLRGLEIHPDWLKIPIFYFSNPSALYGH